MIVIQMLLPRFLVLEVSIPMMFLVKSSVLRVFPSLLNYQYIINRYSLTGRLIFPLLTIGAVLQKGVFIFTNQN